MPTHPNTADRIITLSGSRLTGYSDQDIQDIATYFDPSAVLLTDTNNQAHRQRIDSTVNIPVVDVSEAGVTHLTETTVITAPELEEARELLSQEYEPPVSAITSFIRQEIDPNTFETKLLGLAEYQELVRGRDDITAHLSTTFPAGQRVNQADIPLYGAGFIQSLQGAKIPCITLGDAIYTEELDMSKVGIQAIPGIGRKLRRQLENQGYLSRDDLLATDPTDLLELDGFGPHYAAHTTAGAHAIEREEPVRFIRNTLGNKRRIYVDIETDSLQPQYIWLIGVYDEASGDYLYFINNDEPGNEDEVVREFAEWVVENGADGSYIAWYGNEFDFKHLTEFINRHCKDRYGEIWGQVDKFDLLLDFVKSGVATPARSHQLPVVASRLGYEFEYPHLSGGDAAQAYVAWVAGEREIDWDMWMAYCRDDVLAMKHIYDAIADTELFIDKQELERVYNSETQDLTMDSWDGV